MQLTPCDHCRRHVARESARCPFCHSVLATMPTRVVRRAGRLSRAAIFAGAAACASKPPPATTLQGAPPPPVDPVADPQFAPPPTPVAGKASIHGVVIIDGEPSTSMRVTAHAVGREKLTTMTGPNGEYTFVDIAAGQWTITVDYEIQDHPRNPPRLATKKVTLADGANERRNFKLTTPTQVRDTGPCCKPYGAPPARRRVV